MSYFIDPDTITLDDLEKRIVETDLIPGRIVLLDRLNEKIRILKNQGILTIAALRKEMKNGRKISELSRRTGLDTNYLKLLKLEAEGHFPKPIQLKKFDWLPEDKISKLAGNGFENTAVLYEALNSPDERSRIITTLEMDENFIESLYSLINLIRIQWVSPLFARMLLAAGYDNPTKISDANAEMLCDDLDSINRKNRYWKGKIGLRDVKRVVKAASYL